MWGNVRVWLVTRYEEAKQLLADPRLSKDHARALSLFPPDANGQYASSLSANMLMADPPDHTRLRRLVTRAFTRRAIQHLRASVTEIAEELLNDIERCAQLGPVDLIEMYAAPLPIRVIGKMLGVPDRYFNEFKAAAEAILTSSSREPKAAAYAAMAALLTNLIAEKRRSPAEDLLNDLIAAVEDGDRLSTEDLLATAFLLIVAGYETTINLIGNGVHALVSNPDQLRALRADPALLPNAVEELLRFDGPVDVATIRVSIEPIALGDVLIPPNEFVMISLLSANRDGSRFDAPDMVDISRKSEGHLAFGHGIHHCLGAPLARLEGEIALGRLLARFDTVRLQPGAKLRYRDGALMHGLTSLPVLCSNVGEKS
jgi:cytochrome P450